MQRRVHIVVSGRVQGVGYRASACDKAKSLGITGWVRNLPEGAVEILAEGDKPSMEAFIDWCASGPRWARVDDVQVSDEMPKGDSSSYSVFIIK